MIKIVMWLDDGREEVTVLNAQPTAQEPERSPTSYWEGLHQSFAARLHEKEKEG